MVKGMHFVAYKKIAIIAGGGSFPRLLKKKFLSEGQPFVMLAYQGQTDPASYHDCTHCLTSLGRVGEVLGFFKEHAIDAVVMLGKFHKPSLRDLKVDFKGSLWLAGLLREPRGDDHLLRFLARKLEEEGFQVLAPQSLLPHTLQPPGLFAGILPEDRTQKDLNRGFQALTALSPFDIGQALTMENGWILGIEGLEGTDQLIARSEALCHEENRAFLVKGAKATQDLRLDPPVVGPETLDILKKHKFKGLAFLGNKTLFLEPERMKQVAEEAGLTIFGYEPPESSLSSVESHK